MPVGSSPVNALELNNLIGNHLRQFTDNKETIGHDHEWLLAADLKIDPYNMTADDETLIKSAVANLDEALDAVDMTFISRITGLF